MALIPTIRQITRELLGDDVPRWVDRLLSPINQFMRQVTDALNGNIGTENLAEDWIEITVSDGLVPDPVALSKLQGREVYGLSIQKVTVLPSTPGVPISTTELGAINIALWETRQFPNQNGTTPTPGVAILKIVGIPPGYRVTLRLLAKAR